MILRELQRHTVDAIKRHALMLSIGSPRAEQQILTEYLWSEEGAETIALTRVCDEAPSWLCKLAARQLEDERRHAMLLRARLAELGVTTTRSAPALIGVKMWWLERACQPYPN